MNSAVHDISVLKTLSASGIAEMQIGSSNPNASALPAAGNKFSLIGQTESDYYNNSNFLANYYYNGNGNIREEPQDITPNKVFKYEGFEISCNSRIPGGGPTEEHLLMGEMELNELEDDYDQHEAAYLTLLYNYNSLIDGGNTPILLQQVYETWPSEVWELRQDLLNMSPYLSLQTILETAAAEILPRAMLLEVILANPDVSTDPALMELLLSLNPAVPTYMLELIEASWGQETPRTIIEASMGAQTSAMQHILSRVLHHYAIDSVDQSETVIDWLERAIDLPSKFQLAVLQAERGNYENAQSLLTNLGENDFVLSEEDLLQRAMLTAYIDALSSASANENNYAEIESSILDNLEGYLNSYGEERGYALTLIENLLCVARERCSNLIPTLPGGGNNLRVAGNPKRKTQIVPMEKLSVYPNPAHTFTTVEFELLSVEDKLILSVYNLQGVRIQQLPQKENRAAVLLNTTEYAAGMYYIQLENEKGRVFARQKLVVQ